jgi:hypothetical protein
MLHRRSTATALVAVLLPAAALLSSCGFDYPTDRVNTIGAGVSNREASVEVLGARVLAFSDGNGRLIGTLVNSDNDAEEPTELVSVEGAGVTADVTGVEVAGNAAVNLAADEVTPVVVSGDFAAGDVVPLTFTFSTDESVSLDVPVVKPCGQYTDVASPSPAEAAATDEPAAETEATAEETEAATEESDEGDATYLCEHPTEAAEEGGH